MYYIAFVFAALFLFSIKDAQGFNANIIYNIAVTAGFGRVGGLLASVAVILSSIATLETTMLQFSRTLFAMGRDGAMPFSFGTVDKRTQTPVRAMLVLMATGLLLLWGSSLMPTVGKIIQDGVQAVGVLVAYYYGLAGLVAAREFHRHFPQNMWSWLVQCVYPALSGICLIVLRNLRDHDLRSHDEHRGYWRARGGNHFLPSPAIHCQDRPAQSASRSGQVCLGPPQNSLAFNNNFQRKPATRWLLPDQIALV